MIAVDEIKVDIRVEHGGRRGTVTAVEKHSLTILFDDGEKREFEIPWSLVNISALPTGIAGRTDELIRNALSDNAGISIALPMPEDCDIALAECWSGGRNDRHRMLSARMAERAVALHYKTQGSVVEDVAVTQLNDDPRDDDWVSHDLEVDGTPIDVKNATRSPTRPNRYVSHCVPQFKDDRYATPVTIAATVSDWSSWSDLKTQRQSVVFLGTTTEIFVKRLKAEFSPGPLQIRLRRGLHSPKFLPPWLFVYDSSCYVERDKNIGDFNRLVDVGDYSLSGQDICPTPLFIAGVSRLGDEVEENLSEFQWEIVKSLQSRIERLGSSLAIIFLTVLEAFLHSVLKNHPFKVQELEEVLYLDRHRDRPLLLHDPLRTIQGLIQTLSKAWNGGRSELAQFNFFELYELNILWAKRAKDRAWHTVVAYCGGWKDGKPCGNTPLVIGQHSSCHCRKLICDLCDYCSDECERRHLNFAR